MSGPEQPLQKEASSEKKQSWIMRTWRRLTNRWKWPGWGLLVLLVLRDVPDWKSRLDFWLDAARTAGGYASMTAIVIGSPYFSVALAIAGIAWLVLVGEPRKGVQRHHWLPYLEWIVFAICFTAIVLTAGWGAIQVYARNAVASAHSTEVDALQKQLATHRRKLKFCRISYTKRNSGSVTLRSKLRLFHILLATRERSTKADWRWDRSRKHRWMRRETLSYSELLLLRTNSICLAHFEFRDWTLVCSGQAGGSLSFGAMRQINYPNVVCGIQGAR